MNKPIRPTWRTELMNNAWLEADKYFASISARRRIDRTDFNYGWRACEYFLAKKNQGSPSGPGGK